MKKLLHMLRLKTLWMITLTGKWGFRRGIEGEQPPAVVVAPPIFASIILLACLLGSTSLQAALPTIKSFQATPQTILQGQSSSLSWSVSNATNVTLRAGSIDLGDVGPAGSTSVSPTVTTTYTLVVNGGALTRAITVTVIPPPSIAFFSANKASAEVGSAVTLSWSVANATALSISPVVGTVTGLTTAIVYPTANTTYTLSATGPGGSTSSTVSISTYTISVGITPPSASIPLGGTQAFTGTVSPANQGVSWSTSGGTLGAGAGSGGYYTNVFTGTASGGPFTVSVASLEDPRQMATAQVTVQTVSVSVPVPVPAGPTFVGGAVTFSAAVSGAVNLGVNWSVDDGGIINASGQFTPTKHGTSIIRATSVADPTKSATTTIQVQALDVTVTPATPTVLTGLTQAFRANVGGPGSPPQGVTWSVITPEGGYITSGGLYTAPPKPGDYWVAATSNQDPTCIGTAKVHVIAPPSITSFLADKTSVLAGSPVTLSWSTADATTLSISPEAGVVTGMNSTVVHPMSTTTYILTATGPGGTVTASVPIGTYTISASITPPSATIPLGGTQVFTGNISPANQGVSWSTSMGTLSAGTGSGGSYSNTYIATNSGGPYSVSVASLEDPRQVATALVTVLAVSVGTPVPSPEGPTFVGGKVTFSAAVTGAVNLGVNWSVDGGGTIDASGQFTPAKQGTWNIKATSIADPTKSAVVPIKVQGVEVSVTPLTATVRSGLTQAFTATVRGPGSGTPNQGVTWAVITQGGGSIRSDGVYTAPASPGDYWVAATSIQDPSCTATAKIRVPGWSLRHKRDLIYLGSKEVAEVDAAGVTRVIFTDHLDSPRLEWDGIPASGPDGVHLVEQKFMPFGESLSESVNLGKFGKGFTNHEQTDQSGLIYMQARFYAPMYGRFLSPDPARDQHFEETQSWNIYSYVQNSPTMSIDPDGMQEWNLKTRSLGALKMVGGGLQVAAAYTAGMLSAATGRGGPVIPILAAGAAAKGGDNFQAGAQQLLSGNHVDNASTQGIAGTTGMSVEKARMVDGAVDFAATVSLGAAQFKISANLDVVTGNGGASVSSQASSFAPAEGETRVTRWMSGTEATAMKDSGNLQFGAGGRTYVTELGAPQPGGTGPVQVNFNVPTGSLQQAGKQGWYQILDTKRPPVTGIEVVK